MDAVLRERVKGLISQKKFEKETPKKSRVVKGVSVLLGVLIGFVNGLFGAGGGMLVVPVLTFLLGLNTKRAHATAILIILPLCAVSGVVYLTRGMGGEDMFLPTVDGVVYKWLTKDASDPFNPEKNTYQLVSVPGAKTNVTIHVEICCICIIYIDIL